MKAPSSKIKILKYVFLLLIFSGCAVLVENKFDELYGPQTAQNRVIQSRELAVKTPQMDYKHEAKGVLDKRCVVCHSCWDSPCQLKLSSIKGIDRGSNIETIYNGARIATSPTTRLFMDADSIADWRKMGFTPVLNERQQSPEANLAGSVLYQTLKHKNQQPMIHDNILPDEFDFSLNRSQHCPTIENYSKHILKNPLAGMPYGLPKISEADFNTLKTWIELGAKVSKDKALSNTQLKEIEQWEHFFNGDSLKSQLMNRYIYEHLFLAHLYFESDESGDFFNVVRSSTAPGLPIKKIRTRRPYDDPKVSRVYYRLEKHVGTIVVKTHLAYRLNKKRMQRWKTLFLNDSYQVSHLPAYNKETSSNPFKTFEELPVTSRYKFMLDEARFTLMGFIKGPVCRGQIALSVINDQFWVVFVDPDEAEHLGTAEFLKDQENNLSLPTEQSTTILPLPTWLSMSSRHKKYLKARREVLDKLLEGKDNVSLDIIWDGDKSNRNAALTIFRHFDSATVEYGFLGKQPKTAWVLGYSTLERIHYLLVAGYDVYGNAGHQLITRLYMDFLRMESESAFITLMPKDYGKALFKNWYKEVEADIDNYVVDYDHLEKNVVNIKYKTDKPNEEFFDLLAQKNGDKIFGKTPSPQINNSKIQNELKLLGDIKGATLSHLSAFSILRVQEKDKSYSVYSLIKNRYHKNVSSLLNENKNIIDEKTTLSVVLGIRGSYPNTFFDIKEGDLNDFYKKVSMLSNEEDYSELLTLYGVRRTSENFWEFTDWLHQNLKTVQPKESGLLDLNRFDNR